MRLEIDTDKLDIDALNRQADEPEEMPEGFDILCDFLDAKGYNEKLDMLRRLTPSDVNDYVIDGMAAGIDVSVKQSDDMEERLRSLIDCVKARARFETNRLR